MRARTENMVSGAINARKASRWSVRRSERQAAVRCSSGNRCGHQVGSPSFYEPPGRRPVILTQFIDALEHFYDAPEAIRALDAANGSTRQMRSEAREAVINVLQLLASHLDLTSMQVIRGPQDRQGLDTEWMAKRLGMSEIRVYRAVRYLKLAGMLTVTRWVERKPTGEFRARAAIRVIHPLCFAVLGMARDLHKARRRAADQARREEKRRSRQAQREQQLTMPVDRVGFAQTQLMMRAGAARQHMEQRAREDQSDFMRFYEQMRRERPALSAADIITLYTARGSP